MKLMMNSLILACLSIAVSSPCNSSDRGKIDDHSVVGSLLWARKTQGRLNPEDTLKFYSGVAPTSVSGVKTLLMNLWDRKILGKGQVGYVHLTELDWPGTPAVNDSIDYLKEHSNSVMVNHCFRIASARNPGND